MTRPSRRLYSNKYLITNAIKMRIREHQIKAESCRRRGKVTRAEDHELMVWELSCALSSIEMGAQC